MAALLVSRPHPKVLHIALNRPSKLNALSATLFAEIRAAFAAASDDSNAHTVVLSGEGRAFTAGLDLGSLATAEPMADPALDPARRALLWRRYVGGLQRSLTAIEQCTKPVLAAIHGHCIGAGVDMAACCDVRYAAADAVFCIKEVDLGLAADLGTLQRLPRACGNVSLARELAFTARPFDASEALTLGLVSKVVEEGEVLAAAMHTAAVIADKSPVATVGTKMSLVYSQDRSVEDGLEHVLGYNAAALQATEVAEAFTPRRP